MVIERSAIGGQAGTSSKIQNYLGFPDGITGADLAERARNQACRFGAEFLLLREGVRGEIQAGKGVGYLADGAKVVARASICATGINYRRLELPNEEAFYGRGVYYGAGSSEASLSKGEHVFVIGGGNSAGQAAMHFSQYAARVSVVIRGDCLKKTLSEYLADRIQAAPDNLAATIVPRRRWLSRQHWYGRRISSCSAARARCAASNSFCFGLVAREWPTASPYGVWRFLSRDRRVNGHMVSAKGIQYVSGAA